MNACQSRLRASLPERGTLLVTASMGVAVLVILASLLGLMGSWPYEKETENWALQARGQDIGNLLAVVVLVVSGFRMRCGSLEAAQLWMGTMFYLLYAYVVYAFAVHFGRLFLVYVVILGLVFYTLLAGFPAPAHRWAYSAGAGRTLAALVLIITGLLFAILWLSDLVPATVSGRPPSSLVAAGLIVNPVHVIDLSVVLPGMVIIGVLVLRGNRAGSFLAVPALVFSVLMGASIVAAMILVVMSGETSALIPMVMVSVIVVASLLAAVACLRGTTALGRSQHVDS